MLKYNSISSYNVNNNQINVCSVEGDSMWATVGFIVRFTMWCVVSWHNCHWAGWGGSTVIRPSSYASPLPDSTKSTSTAISSRRLYPRIAAWLHIQLSGQGLGRAPICPPTFGTPIHETWCCLCRQGEPVTFSTDVIVKRICYHKTILYSSLWLQTHLQDVVFINSSRG